MINYPKKACRNTLVATYVNDAFSTLTAIFSKKKIFFVSSIIWINKSNNENFKNRAKN